MIITLTSTTKQSLDQQLADLVVLLSKYTILNVPTSRFVGYDSNGFEKWEATIEIIKEE
jgi:hypothetical protein